MFQRVQVPSMEAPSHHRSHTRRRERRPTRRKPGRKSLRWPFGVRSVREASNFAGRSESETGSPEIIPPLGNGFEGSVGKRRTRPPRAKAAAVDDGAGHIQSMGSPGILEDDMQRRSRQRKPGTTRWSPRPLGTAKAWRINRSAAKSRCADEWDGWGRLSEDGPGQNNPDRSEGP
jgi:hypothetical protein